MSVTIGTKLGSYEITALLGKGGMGEVYRAHDSRLARDVAVKILPPHLSTRPDLRERFEREARTVAALNHPHICSIFDVGVQDGVDYIVMEYLEGQTLSARINKGPVPVPEALKIAVEILGALDKAHREGVTHRDLKPSNSMLTRAGAKLLDFGLAKLTSQPVSDQEFSDRETAKSDSSLTAQGTILGTLQYMAPEQLEGREADARTDIFAFGTVLYEMMTAKKAFQGKSKASLIASIIEREPQPILSIQPAAPAALDHVIQMCMAKDPDERWQNCQNIAAELKWVMQGSAMPRVIEARSGSKFSHRQAWAVGAAFAAITVALSGAFAYLYFKPPDQNAIRFSIPLPENTTLPAWADSPFPTISPDGRYLAFTTVSPEGSWLLSLRTLDSSTVQAVPGTENAHHPFWSPDSRFIAFFAGGKLKKVSVTGGLPQVLCDVPDGDGAGGTWNPENVIIFGDTGSGSGALYRVSATGGTPTPVIEANQVRQERHGFPHFLPDGRRFLFLTRSPQPEQSAVYLASLDSNQRKRILIANSRVIYSPPGYLLFAQTGKLMAQPFDVRRGEITGDVFTVVDQIVHSALVGSAAFSASRNGILAFREGMIGGQETQLTWLDRNGKQLGIVEASGRNIQPSLAPDGQQVVVAGEARSSSSPVAASLSSDIWLIDLMRGTNSRVTFQGGGTPIWAPDGKSIAFTATRSGRQGVYRKAATGTDSEELLVENSPAAMDWSTDGRFIIFRRDSNTTDIWALPTFGDRKAFPALDTRFNENFARLSPDTKWIAYASDESGRFEIYVQNFPPSGGKWQVSREGALYPRWRRDGRELFYNALNGKIMAVDVKLGPTFEVGVPRMLFEIPAPIVGNRWIVTPDGQRFLFPFAVAKTGRPPITIITNWTATIKK